LTGIKQSFFECGDLSAANGLRLFNAIKQLAQHINFFRPFIFPFVENTR